MKKKICEKEIRGYYTKCTQLSLGLYITCYNMILYSQSKCAEICMQFARIGRGGEINAYQLVKHLMHGNMLALLPY